MDVDFNECRQYFGTTNVYEIFRITKIATVDEVRKAYYKLSLTCHPDRVEEEKKAEATERFKIVGKIYSILSDPEKRALYDANDKERDDVKEANVNTREDFTEGHVNTGGNFDLDHDKFVNESQAERDRRMRQTKREAEEEEAKEEEAEEEEAEEGEAEEGEDYLIAAIRAALRQLRDQHTKSSRGKK